MLVNKEKKTELKENTSDEVLNVIGIGCSAGGLNALQNFFTNCPSDTGLAFVIIQHLSPNYESMMTELLSKHTQMKVKQTEDEEELKADHVYLMSGDKNIVLKSGRLSLVPRAKENQINFAVDLFFNSLAATYNEQGISVILSGTGTDGTKGAKAIKDAGGVVFVQDPEDSQFDGMPRSVITSGLNDFVLPIEKIPEQLVRYVDHLKNSSPLSPESFGITTEVLNSVLQLLKDYNDHDFFSYKKNTLLRRLQKRINETEQRSVEKYIEYLKESDEEREILNNEFLIGVTSLFRDQEAYSILKTKIIPEIIDRKQQLSEPIKIWVIACSTGEEAYSLAILFEEHLVEHNIKNVQYKIFATDIDTHAITTASKGSYKLVPKEIPNAVWSKYFSKEDDKYRISPAIRQKIIFSKHDVLNDPAFHKVDFISCRNMLIYLNNDAQSLVLTNIHYALHNKGYLFLGISESLRDMDVYFETLSKEWKIYQKIVDVKIIPKKRDRWKISTLAKQEFSHKQIKQSLLENVDNTLLTTLIREIEITSICIDINFEIIHAYGEVQRYLSFPPKGFSNNILKMLPNELSISIITSIRKLISTMHQTEESENVIERKIKLIEANKQRKITIIIRPVLIEGSNSNYFLITFLEKNIIGTNEQSSEGSAYEMISQKDIEELEYTLSETRENLQVTIEELETSNEEMQTTNEELLASNEELQSINEELQSVNEELHTVNGELYEKNALLMELNSDVENLVNNINIGTIFLDKEFKIRKFTPSIDVHFQLREEDIGRPISHFSGILGGKNLTEYAASVIETLQPLKKEIQNTAGVWFMMEIFPYRYHVDEIKGVVVNFINIDDIKTAYYKEKLNDFLTHIMNDPPLIYIYDVHTQTDVYHNDSIWNKVGYSDLEIQEMGTEVLKRTIHPDDYPQVAQHFQQLSTIQEGEVSQIEYRLIRKDQNGYIWVLRTDKLHEKDRKGKVQKILGVVHFITNLKNMEYQLKETDERFRLAIMAAEAGLWEWTDVSKDATWWSKEFQELLGYHTLPFPSSITILIEAIHPEYREAFEEGVQHHVAQGISFKQELQIKTADGEYRWFLMNAIAQTDPNQHTKKVVGTLIDVHDRKIAERKMSELNVELERFAYLASHDLKEPLRTITSFTQLFNEEYHELLDDTAKQYMGFIGEASNRMISLTNDLLAYSQLDNKSLNFQEVDVNVVLSEILADLSQKIEESEAEIVYSKLPHVVCDMLQIRQLFQNLITNSLKYRNTENTRIHIDVEEEKTYWKFSVKDNGIGIDPKYHKKIFEVFKRLHNQDDYEGTGIGLAYCKRIVDNHKGTIWVSSTLGEGATFYFTILKTKSL